MGQHMLTPPEVGWVDKHKSGKVADGDSHIVRPGFAADNEAVFVANAAGTTTTLVGAAAALGTSTNCARLGERFMLFDSTGKPKEATVFTVTAHNGTTTVTFTPAAAVATASGDEARLVQGSAFDSMNSLDEKLIDLGYTQVQCDQMTMNDKMYAIRLGTDSSQFK